MRRSKSFNNLFDWNFEVNEKYHCHRCGNMTPIGKRVCDKCLHTPVDMHIYDFDTDDETMYELVGGYFTDLDIDLTVPINCFICNEFCGTDDHVCIRCKQHTRYEGVFWSFILIVFFMLIVSAIFIQNNISNGKLVYGNGSNLISEFVEHFLGCSDGENY